MQIHAFLAAQQALRVAPHLEHVVARMTRGIGNQELVVIDPAPFGSVVVETTELEAARDATSRDALIYTGRTIKKPTNG